jgi:hypothetical protein
MREEALRVAVFPASHSTMSTDEQVRTMKVPRMFTSITRTLYTDEQSVLDAIADDGTAWWNYESSDWWQPIPSLPDREVIDFETASMQTSPPLADVSEAGTLAAIFEGLASFYVVVASNDKTDGDGTPIAWETEIPAGSSLQAVLQHQQRLGSRYGTTYVAVCRIIPALTCNA